MSFEYTIKNFIIYNVFSLTSIKCCDDLLSYMNKKWRNNDTQTKPEQAQVNILHKNKNKNKNKNTKEQWFQLHAFINACIVYFSYNDVYDCLMNPSVSIQPCSNLFAGSFALMLHVYHSYVYQMTYIDKLHHGISVFLATPLCLLYQTKGISMYYFFGTGLPGGIDYFLLSVVKQKKNSRGGCRTMRSVVSTHGAPSVFGKVARYGSCGPQSETSHYYCLSWCSRVDI